MTLLHIIGSADPACGGPIEAVKQFAVALQKDGHCIEVACCDAPESPWIAELPFKTHALGPRRSGYGYSPKLSEWLTENSQKFQAIIIDGIWQYHGYAAHRVLRKLGKPYSVFTHGMLDPWFKHQYPLKHLKKRLYWRFGEYPVLRDAQSVLFTCAEEAELAKQSFLPNRWTSKIVNLGTSGSSGIADEERASFFLRFPELADKRIVLFFGRVAEKKGVDLLIEAFAKVAESDSKLQLVLAGPVEPQLEQQLKAQAEALGISDRIVWTGMLLGSERWGAYRTAEVFILSSHQENFGISVAEALACGVPVLISNKVNIWREIEADGAGFVEADTVTGTVALLEKWCDLTVEDRAEMGKRAHACYFQRFEIRKAAHSLLDALTMTTAGVEPS